MQKKSNRKRKKHSQHAAVGLACMREKQEQNYTVWHTRKAHVWLRQKSGKTNTLSHWAASSQVASSRILAGKKFNLASLTIVLVWFFITIIKPGRTTPQFLIFFVFPSLTVLLTVLAYVACVPPHVIRHVIFFFRLSSSLVPLAPLFYTVATKQLNAA